jgi:hypothetical protein
MLTLGIALIYLGETKPEGIWLPLVLWLFIAMMGVHGYCEVIEKTNKKTKD